MVGFAMFAIYVGLSLLMLVVVILIGVASSINSFLRKI